MLNQLLGLPVLLFLVLLPFVLAAVVILRTWGSARYATTTLNYLALGLLAAAILGLLYFASIYLISLAFTDHIEPNTAVVAWLYANGGQIYHPVDAAERYSFLYGPLAYIATGLIYQAFGASTLTAKLAGFVCLLLSLFVLGYAVRRRYPDRWYPCIVALGYFSLIALFFKNHSFWSKPDPFMILAVGVGLVSCLMANRRGAWLLLGAALGLAVNAKITGAIYFLPLLAWQFERDGFRAVLVCGLTAMLVAVLPFLSPSVSLLNYIAWLQSAGDHGLSIGLLIQNFLFILFACIPVLLFLLWQKRVEGAVSILAGHKLVMSASIIAVLLILVAASKPGSGPHHFLPFLPLLAFLTASTVEKVAHTGSRRWTAYAFWAPVAAMLIAAFLKAGFAFYYGVRVVNSQVGAIKLIDEVASIVAKYPDRNVYMGYGDGSRYTRTFVRNYLVYAGHPYFIDAPALMDFQLSGIEIPQATIDRMLADNNAVWLIPAGNEPFTILNWYFRFNEGFLFSDAFRDAFSRTFRKQDSAVYFDVYVGSGESKLFESNNK